ncbi:MAG: hypothetical protein M3Y59_15255 [Myxococcota bacterium]|nr:hypothetical protein [Myxococcota bacterium]
MRIGSMINLADCVLILDGQRIPLSEPDRSLGDRWVFGVSAADTDYLAAKLGSSGIVQTRDGVVLLRLQVQAVDPTLHLVHGVHQPR